MLTDPRSAAHAAVASFEAERGPGAWQLDRAAIGARLHELVDSPSQVRQGGQNLCGAAAVLMVWLERDPEAAVAYAVRMFEDGRAQLGSTDVTAPPALRRFRYAASPRAERCPAADWMLMAPLRHTANRVLPYATPAGWLEPIAAITMPGTVRRWLAATELFGAVRDETNVLVRQGWRHASTLEVGPARVVIALIAQELLRLATSRLRRARDAAVALVPNHWIVLRATPTRTGAGLVGLRFWSWGREYALQLPESRFERCYFGALVGEVRSGITQTAEFGTEPK